MKYSKIKKSIMMIVVAVALAGCGTQGEETYTLGSYDCSKTTYTECELSDVQLGIFVGDRELNVEVDDPEVDATYLQGTASDDQFSRTFSLDIGDICNKLYNNEYYDGMITGDFVYYEQRYVGDRLYQAFHGVDRDAVGEMNGSGGYELELMLGEYQSVDDMDESKSFENGVAVEDIDSDDPDEILTDEEMGLESQGRDVMLTLQANIVEREGQECRYDTW